MDGMNDFLKGIEAEVEAPETEAIEPVADTTVEPQTEAPVRDEKGRFAPKGEPETAETPAAPPVVEETNTPVPVKALQEERRKRQELEARLAQFEQQMAAQQSQQPPVEIPSVFEDEDGYFNQRLQQVLPSIEEQILGRIKMERVQESIEDAKGKYEDFSEVTEIFKQMAQTNPVLEQQFVNHRNPAEFAYKTAKTHAEIQQYGSLDALVEAKVAAKLQTQTPPTPAPVIPTSLAGEQSSSTADVAPPVLSLDQILGRKPL